MKDTVDAQGVKVIPVAQYRCLLPLLGIWDDQLHAEIVEAMVTSVTVAKISICTVWEKAICFTRKTTWIDKMMDSSCWMPLKPLLRKS